MAKAGVEPGGLSHGLCMPYTSEFVGTQEMLSKYLQNEWIKSNLKEGWSAWLREVIELWLIGVLGYT